ncbi:MAG TPA: inositol monophosphatase family protein [Fibrobacteraceae bacterium]|nr:inositol monophosphatase family protein [Fibrobacteraceae bacterium]
MSELQELLTIALKATEIARIEILRHFGQKISVDWKPDRTPVTIADRNTEELVRHWLGQETPEFGLIGEEFGRTNPQAEYQWILDPIDGTKSFVRGVPLFGTLLALYHRGQARIGIISLPALDSVLHAASGMGAWVDDVQVHVSDVSQLSQATVLSGTLNTMEAKGYGESFARIRRTAQLYRGWGDCYGYYLVACGRAEVMVDPVVSIWDIAPMPVIFAEAGGRFSEISGGAQLLGDQGELRTGPEGYTGVATNFRLYDAVLDAFPTP